MATILRYVAKENLPAAERLRDRFYEAFALLGEHPHVGQERKDLTRLAVRFWPAHQNYMIVYHVQHARVLILRVYHVARHIAAILPE